MKNKEEIENKMIIDFEELLIELLKKNIDTEIYTNLELQFGSLEEVKRKIYLKKAKETVLFGVLNEKKNTLKEKIILDTTQ